MSSGVRTRSLSCPEFFDLIYFYLVKDLDEEKLEEFKRNLDSIELEQEAKRLFDAKRADADKEKVVEQTTGDKQKVVMAPTDKDGKKLSVWQTDDPNWRPPGWKSDEEAFRNSMGFMGWNSSGRK